MNKSRVGGTPPKVFVIVLTWNHLSDTLECLRSLESLEYPSYQTVVVDNGSEDNTPRIVREKFPNVVVIENERNLGYAEGNNVGIRYALSRGADFVFLLNNDTVVDGRAVDELVSAALEYPRAGVFSPKIYSYASPETITFAGAWWVPEKLAFQCQRADESDSDKYSMRCAIDTASGCALFFRGEVARKVGLLDPRFFLLWEETDWCNRVRRQGYSLLFVPESKVWHKDSQSFQGGAHGLQYQYYYTRNRLLWIEKNLKGTERVRAYVRCAHELYWWGLYLRRKNLPREDYLFYRARLRGGFHYVLRKFGKQSLA